jgi:hypothetical protein
MKTVLLLASGSFILSLLAGAPAYAQGFGEQRALQFRFSNNGLTNEVYRRQLGASAVSSSSSSTSGGSEPGQAGSGVNNAVQTTRYLNITVDGQNNVLNVVGETINAEQKSTGTQQSSTNEQISQRLNR